MGADGNGAPTGATMVDAQLTITRVLKPFAGFERIYQGVTSDVPIAFPGTLDRRAQDAEPGFDPNLLSGIPVPQGSRVLLWFPICIAANPDVPLSPFQLYSYRLVWRYQNLNGYRDPATKTKRAPYHLARQSPGAPDSSLGTPIPRVVLPASWHVLAYEESEPALPGGAPGQLNIRVEQIIPRINDVTLFVQPLVPSGRKGVIEQGIIDPATLPLAGAFMPNFVPFWTDAEGDELIILVNRTDASSDPANAWDFTDPAKDLAFSNTYGTGNGAHESFRDLGIYMQTGTTP